MAQALYRNVVVVSAGAACWLAGAGEFPSLTLEEAHETALRDHPLISVADLKALAARQVVRQVQSAFFPNLSANGVGVGDANSNTRLEAIGALNSPAIFQREAQGLVLSQLITDFGRTANLTGSAKLRAQAAANSAQATRQQILLAVDGAFYSAQHAQAVTRVAEQTLTARQAFLNQVSALASNGLRSDLDASFARVDLEQAKVLLLSAQNDFQASLAQLAALLGLREPKPYRLVEQGLPPALSTNVADFVRQALLYRPDLLSLRDQRDAASRFARAEKAARYPAVSAVGAAGLAPVHDTVLPDSYAAGGVIVSLPLFAGGYYKARQRAAELEARADEASVRDLEDNVIRDVRVAWLSSQNAFDRYRVNLQLLDNARQSYGLAHARYTTGISSIVEFEQAEVNLVSAQIALATTQYEYLTQRSVLTFQIGALR